MGLGRARWHGTQGLPHHFDGLYDRPVMLFSLRSPRNRALRGHRAGFLGVGSGGDQGQRRPRAGHSRRLWERLWERRIELGTNTYEVRVPRASTNLDKIFDQALILWCGMVTCGRAEIPVLGRDMGALGFKFPTTHRAYGGAGSELRRAEGGMVRSSEGTQRRSFSSLG